MKYKLFDHQQQGVDLIMHNDGNGALFWDCGLGKTLGALDVFRRLREKNPALKMMIFCPISLIEAAWGEDIVKFTDYKYCNLRKTKIKDTFDIYIVNFESTARFEDRLRELFRRHEFIGVIDESSKIKNNTSQITKRMLSLRHMMKHRLILSATPAPNIETEYWPQITFVRDGVFHRSFFAFKNKLFYLGRGNQRMSATAGRDAYFKGFKLCITDDNRKKISDRISPFCHWANKEECLDLPEMVDQTRLIILGKQQERLYKKMKSDLIVELSEENVIVAQIALTKIMKLRQITSGFLIDEHGQSHDLPENPKFRELGETLEQIGDKQVIIWCQFKHEIQKIQSHLAENNHAVGVLSGQTGNKDDVINRFKAGDIKYLIAHPRSAAHGLTFVNCSYMIFYSLDYSVDSYLQASCRIHRPGQKNKCTNIHLLCENTIDTEIMAIVKNKEEMSSIVSRYAK